MNSQHFVIAFGNLGRRKLRSWLTVLGIVIGIAAIVSLILISEGLQNTITEAFETMGSNKIFIMPKTFGAPGTGAGLTTDDLDVVEDIPDFELVTPYVYKVWGVSHREEQQYTYVMGLPNEDAEEHISSFSVTISTGRAWNDRERGVAVIGPRVATGLFERDLGLHSQLEINDIKFRVIGIFDSIGNPDDDSSIYLPMDDAKMLFGLDDEIGGIVGTVKAGRDMDDVAAKLTRNLERARDNDNFDIMTAEDLLEQLGSILLIVQLVLISIAAISLIVGGVGIMNSMYTNVLERTKEIGIMKAIGANRADIRDIFLAESAILGAIGGTVGVAIGVLISQAFVLVAALAGYELLVRISPWIVCVGLAFAVIVGVLSGTLPAIHASRLHPVDAMRTV